MQVVPLMRRVLLVMIQPPGCSGVQGLIYNKLLPYLEGQGWEFHFAGPAPWLFSVLTEELNYPSERLHYTTNVSGSHRFSVEKNRHAKKSLPYLFFGGLQLVSRLVERLIGHDSDAYLLRGLEKTVRQAERAWNFDLIAGKSPDFKVLRLVSQITRSLQKPFLAMVVDPYGARDEAGFYPTTPELQREILDQSCGALFMSPLTMDRYLDAGLVSPAKAHYFTDSYPEMPELYQRQRSALAGRSGGAPAGPGPGQLQLIYLGMLPEWRPIEAFLEAFSDVANQADGTAPFRLSIFGYVYPAAQQRINANPGLAELIQVHPMVSYTQSHLLAEDADIQFVVIGPRHLDNFPSKFFEYLGHHKPILVLGPLQNPLKKIVDDLQIGCYVDSRDYEAIREALLQLQSNYSFYKEAYSRNADAIETFSAHRVAEHFCRLLDGALALQNRPRLS
ncbi:MAG: hypothetical protein RLZZ609_2814 [Cyanobacteriota bacterium]|jgi:glycosyltransferase involved in cell wall biosynthesis